MNEKWLAANPTLAQNAYNQIQAETAYYNQRLAGGKWNNMMSANPHNQPVFQKPAPTPGPAPAQTPENASTATPPYYSFSAASANRTVGAENATWTVIPGLGRSGKPMTLLPSTSNNLEKAELDYDFSTPTAAPAKVLVYCIPTHAIYPGLRLRYSAAIDAEPPQSVDIDTTEFSPAWSVNVLRAAAIGTTAHTLTAGRHTLKLCPLDPGVVFDKIVIDLGNLKPSQLGPPETARASN
jgi:hypothetical protein